MKKIKFTVVREKWLRGCRDIDGSITTESYLRSESGGQCCLGFLAKKLGYRNKEILHVDVPVGLHDTSLFPEEFLEPIIGERQSGKILYNIIVTNDDDRLSDKKREKKLKQLFKQANIKIRFRNKSEI